MCVYLRADVAVESFEHMTACDNERTIGIMFGCKIKFAE